jgi:hypothetical protein
LDEIIRKNTIFFQFHRFIANKNNEQVAIYNFAAPAAPIFFVRDGARDIAGVRL